MKSLQVFSDSAAGALSAIWAKLPQSLVLEGENNAEENNENWTWLVGKNHRRQHRGNGLPRNKQSTKKSGALARRLTCNVNT